MLRVAVITPYFAESLEILQQAHDSVRSQSWPCTHVLVADGRPRAEVDGWEADHIRLPRAHHDIGSTPRLIGCYHAIGLGFDALAFLDADNWYGSNHIESLVRLHEANGAGFLSSSRMLCRLDGSIMGQCPLTDPQRFVDTSCMMVFRAGFGVLAQWVLMPSYCHLIGDRVMLHYIRESGLTTAHTGLPSVFYRCGKEGLYLRMNEPVPPGVQPRPDYKRVFARWEADGFPPLA